MEYEATLVKGRCYFLGSRRFNQNEPQRVTEETKEYLEANAVDPVTIERPEGKEVLSQSKFEFVAIEGADPDESPPDPAEEDAPPPATRTRSRAGAAA